MKQILGDNQFFGVNHNDLDKGDKTKFLFQENTSIISFINDSIQIGLDGCMINSNKRGYQIVEYISQNNNCEVHYSVPYPHKYASIVNEGGMMALLSFVLKKASIRSLIINVPKFFMTGNIKYILPLILELEIPRGLKKGSYIYLQNIVTDLVIGMKRNDLLESFCKIILGMGYMPGLITLNPILLDEIISQYDVNIQKKLIVCFNINKGGFNVFPCVDVVEKLIIKDTKYMKMGMSILSSGGTDNILSSIEYIKGLPLDYVVYGSSNINNVKMNYNLLK